jgi:hypothetical protein
MATIGGSNIITNGLVLALDAANRRSYVSGSTIWNDVSGNRNSGSLVNGPTFSSADGGSIVFDGSNDFVNLGQAGNFPTTQSFTISIWFKTSYAGSNQQQVIGKCNLVFATNNYVGYTIGMNVCTASPPDIGKFGIAVVTDLYPTANSVTRRQTTLAYNNNSWVNAVTTYDGSRTRSGILIYMNGILSTMTDFDSASITGSILNASNFQIAARDGAQLNFQGETSVAQIYNRALSPQEVLQNYEALKSRYGL